jgi:hypothetical protein
MKSIPIEVIGIGALIVLLVAIGPRLLEGYQSRQRDINRGRAHVLSSTRTEARNLSLGLADLAFDDPSSFLEFPKGVMFHGTEAMFLRLQYHSVYNEDMFSRRRARFGGIGFRDFWGQPFIFYISPSAESTNVSGQPVYRYEISVWSSGPNRRNDRGLVDDLAFTNRGDVLVHRTR